MLRRLFFRQRCNPATEITPINSGSPKGASKIDTFLRQYIISIPMTAGGSVFPKYVISFGVVPVPLKSTKGAALRANVITAITRIIMMDSLKLKVMVFYPPSH